MEVLAIPEVKKATSGHKPDVKNIFIGFSDIYLV